MGKVTPVLRKKSKKVCLDLLDTGELEAFSLIMCTLTCFFRKLFFQTWNDKGLIVRFSPSCNVIDYCTTMTSADFSRQALLRFFRKSNYLKRP